eukprot:813444-Karenia_brevis.AAC.1
MEDVQQRRIVECKSIADAHVYDGGGQVQVWFIDFLTALARSKTNKQGGVDGLVVEHIKELPHPALLWLFFLFVRRLTGFENSDPDGWRFVELVGKAKKAGAIGFDDFRFLAMSAVLEKLYLRFVIETQRRIHQNYT